MRRVRDGSFGSQRRGYHGGLSYLCLGCARAARIAGVDVDAIGALSSERNGDSNQLLVLYRDCSSGDGSLIECPEGFHYFRREGIHFFQVLQIFFVIHSSGLAGKISFESGQNHDSSRLTSARDQASARWCCTSSAC